MSETASRSRVREPEHDVDEPVDVLIRTTGERARHESLQRAIASVVGQQDVAARPILVVVGKRPGPIPEAASRNAARIHRLGDDAPPGGALRIARGLVRTSFYAFLDDDDELLPDALATRLSIMRAEPAVHVVVTTGYSLANGRRRIHIPDIARHQDDSLNGIIERCWLASCGGLFRASAVSRDYFEGLPDLCEWTCLAFRLALNSHIRFVDHPTYNVYDTAGSLSKSDAFLEASLGVLDSMRGQVLPLAQRDNLERKYRAALHAAAERCRRSRNLAKAWRYHLKSMKPPHTLRYGAYTRKLLWKGNGSAT